ncbi:MAG: MBL fold metallo-hydrolase [Magnetococcales bacterium]|nr:MBL fold metallo-hydrolase [Magnetococcales bacterium]
MKLTFRGVRGSIPAPGPKTVRYGGNTTCIEIRTDDNDLIILDAGTGIFPLAHTLFPELPITAHVFITHTHWDHIQGLPFFIPLFIPGNTVHLYGARDPVYDRDLQEIMAQQWQHTYYPVRDAELKAHLHYHTLREGETIPVGENTTVTNIFMNHPVLNFGYRIECNGKSIFFTGDHEHLLNIFQPDELGYEGFQLAMDEKSRRIIDFIKGVDILIADTSYTEDEYPERIGWGHGTYDKNVALAREAGAKQLYFTHHEPTRSDDDLDTLLEELKGRYPAEEGMPICHLAREGELIEL